MNTALALALYNRVLAITGQDTIASFTDGTPLAQLGEAIYEPEVRALLDDPGYNWSQRYFTLSYVPGDSPTRFRYVYQRPADALTLRSVVLPSTADPTSAREIPYMPYGDKITCDYDSSAGIMALYSYRVDEALWPPRFEKAVAQRLEELVLKSEEKFSEAQFSAAQAAQAQREARYTSATERGGRVAFKSRLVAARRNVDRQ